MAVHGAVAERVDHPRLAEHRLARGLLEARLVDQRGQVVLIGQPQRGVVLVGPRHRQLQRAPGVEAGRARVGVHRALRPFRPPRTRRAIRAGGRRTGSVTAASRRVVATGVAIVSQYLSRFCRNYVISP